MTDLRAIRCATIGLMLVGSTARPASAQQIRARVVDSASRSAISDAVALLVAASGDTIATASSGADGFFRLAAPRAGAYTVLIRRLDYHTQQRSVTVGADDLVLPAVVLERAAILLDSITAQVSRERAQPTTGSGRPSYTMSGERMATLERVNASIGSALTQIGAIRVRTISDYVVDSRRYREYVCVESIRGTEPRGNSSRGNNPCRTVALVFNGVLIGDPNDMWQSLRIADLESIEYIPSMDAQLRYGLRGGANGAVELWSRGSGPHRGKDRGTIK